MLPFRLNPALLKPFYSLLTDYRVPLIQPLVHHLVATESPLVFSIEESLNIFKDFFKIFLIFFKEKRARKARFYRIVHILCLKET